MVHELLRIDVIAHELALREGLQPSGLSRVAGHEHELTLLGAFGLPREADLLRVGRLAALVGAQEREVEPPARIAEVVGVAAEVSALAVRHGDETQIVEVVVAVELVAAALIERDDLVLLGGIRGLGRLLDGLGAARGDLGRHVALAHELRHDETRQLDLGFVGAGVEAVLEPVVLTLHAGDRIARAVVVRHHEPVRAHERSRAGPPYRFGARRRGVRIRGHDAAEAQRREPRVLEPIGRRLPVVGLLEPAERCGLERPHAAQFLAGLGRGRRDGHAAAQERERETEQGTPRGCGNDVELAHREVGNEASQSTDRARLQ
jgi:hypothetical protein